MGMIGFIPTGFDSAEMRAADRHAWAMLQRARPEVIWKRESVRRLDLTGEGTVSRVLMGHVETVLVIGLVRPGRESRGNPQSLNLAGPLKLAPHPLEREADCRAPDGGALAGCRPRRGQKGLTLTIGEQAVYRVYWNAELKRFDVHPPLPEIELPPLPVHLGQPAPDADLPIGTEGEGDGPGEAGAAADTHADADR